MWANLILASSAAFLASLGRTKHWGTVARIGKPTRPHHSRAWRQEREGTAQTLSLTLLTRRRAAPLLACSTLYFSHLGELHQIRTTTSRDPHHNQSYLAINSRVFSKKISWFLADVAWCFWTPVNFSQDYLGGLMERCGSNTVWLITVTIYFSRAALV